MYKTIVLLFGIFLVAACGESSSETVTEPVDITSLAQTVDVQTVAALQGRKDVVLIDVREQWEYDEGHIPGITLIPMSEIESRVSEIPTDKTVILTCRSGNRSGQVFDWLTQNGYENLHNMQGGILAWEAAGLEVE